MSPILARKVSWKVILPALLQLGCLAESDPATAELRCGPRDLTPECCLKQNPGQWERCTGTSKSEQASRPPSLRQKVAVAGAAATLVALPPRIGTAEQRGAELAEELLEKAEQAIERCTRQADQRVNDHHFQGKSPSAEVCRQLKSGDKTTWAIYLGLFKHEQAWPCLREALDLLLPGRYWLQPRFRVDDRTGKWEFLGPEAVKQIVATQGWKGLEGTIEPDLLLLNDQGFIVRLYDLKFPCPETNPAIWTRYTKGRWQAWQQGDLYHQATQVSPLLVSPRQGIIIE